jgi:O-antigen/teichoic acid export membrane protein
MQVLRGIALAAILFVSADFVAWLFQSPEATWAYRALALVPLIRGFIHLDYRRFERAQNYMAGSMSHLGATVVSTFVAILYAYFFQSFYAMLAAYVVQSAVFALLTHLFAKSSYKLQYDSREFAELLPYGTPLILNGLLLFAITQGDRIVIGSKLGMTALATYGIISVFTVGIMIMVSKLAIPLYTPVLAQAVPGSPEHNRRYMICGSISAILAMAALIGFGIAGFPAAQVAFGTKYELDALLIMFLGMQTGFKILRSWPQIGLLASGDTKSILYANIVSLVGIVAASVLIANGYGLTHVAFAMASGEAISAIFTIARNGEAGSSVQRHGVLLLIGMFGVAALIGALQYLQLVPLGLIASLGLGMLIGLAALVFINLVSPDFFTAVRDMSRKALKRS